MKSFQETTSNLLGIACMGMIIMVVGFIGLVYLGPKLLFRCIQLGREIIREVYH